MKQTLFTAWFENGKVNSHYAFSPVEAAILAQAGAIKRGYGCEVATIQNEETRQVYSYQNPSVVKIEEVT